MANKNINDFPGSSALTGAELIEVLQGGVNKKGDLTTLRNFTNKYSDFTAASGLDGSEVLPLLQSGALKRSTLNTILSSISGYANVQQYGAKGDGVTNDTQAFIDALATGKPVYVPKGTYIVNPATYLSLADGQKIFGDGYQSAIKTTTVPPAPSDFVLTNYKHIIRCGTKCTVDNLRFVGPGKTTYDPGGSFPWTTGNAIWVESHDNLVTNCYFEGIYGSGIFLCNRNVTAFYDNRIFNCFYDGCTVAQYNYGGAEYITTNVYTAKNCQYGHIDLGANNVLSNFAITYNTIGLRVKGGSSNSDHSLLFGGKLNHNDKGFELIDVAVGYQFIGVELFYGGVSTISECLNIIFNSCQIGMNITVTATTAKEVQINSCSFWGSPTITNSSTAAVITYNAGSGSGGGAGVTDGDKGDIVVSSGGTTWMLDATGTRDSTTFLRGDGQWATPAGGGGGTGFTNIDLAADQSTSAAAYSNITGFTFPVLAGKVYVVEATLLWTSAGGGGAQGLYIRSHNSFSPAYFTQNAVITNNTIVSTTTPSSLYLTPNDANTQLARVTIGFKATANGTFQMEMYSNTAGNAVTILQGSNLKYKQTN